MTESRIKTSIYLKAEVKQELDDLAAEHNRSLNGEIAEALERYVQLERRRKRKLEGTK